MVFIANHLVPDFVSTRIGPLGDVVAVVVAVQRVRQFSACYRHVSNIDQLLRTAVVGQTPGFLRLRRYGRIRPGDGPRYRTGIVDGVFCCDLRRDGPDKGDGFVFSNTRPLERSLDFHAAAEVIRANQSPIADRQLTGICISVVGLLRCCHNCGNRPGLCEEVPSGDSTAVFGRRNRDGSAAGNCVLSGSTGQRAGHGPCHITGSGTAPGAEFQRIAVADSLRFSGNLQRSLVVINNRKRSSSRVRKGAVGPLVSDCYCGGTRFNVVGVRYRVLRSRDYQVICIVYGHCGGMRFTGILEHVLVFRQDNRWPLHNILANRHHDPFDRTVLVVLVPQHFGRNHVSPGFDSSGDIGTVADGVSRVDHNTVIRLIRAAHFNQFLRFSGVDQIFNGQRFHKKCCFGLRNCKCSYFVEPVITVLSVLDDDTCGTDPVIVKVSSRKVRNTSALCTYGYVRRHRTSGIRRRIGRLPFQQNGRSNRLFLNRYRHRVLCIVDTIYLVPDCVSTRIFFPRNRCTVVAALHFVHHAAIYRNTGRDKVLFKAVVDAVDRLRGLFQGNLSCLDGKGCTAAYRVVPAGVIGNRNGRLTRIDIVAVTHRVLTGRNHPSPVPDENIRFFRGAVILEGVRGQRDVGVTCTHGLRGNGHRQDCCGGVCVVCIVSHCFVPDVVSLRIGPHGDVLREDGSIQRILHVSACRYRTWSDQRFRTAVIGQIRDCLRSIGHTQDARGNGRGGCGRMDNVVLLAEIRSSDRGVNGHGGNDDYLVGAHICILETPRCRGSNYVTAHYVAAVEYHNKFGAVIPIVGLVFGYYGRQNRLRVRVEGPFCRNRVISIDFQSGGNRNRLPGLQDLDTAVLPADSSDILIVAGPRHRTLSVSAGCAQVECVAVQNPAGLIYDGQRTLLLRTDGKRRFSVGTCSGNAVVSAGLSGDSDRVVTNVFPVLAVVLHVSDLIAPLRNHDAVVVLHRNLGFLHGSVIGGAVGRELDREFGHHLRGDGHRNRIVRSRRSPVIVVAVALHAVVDRIFTRIGAGGDAHGPGKAIQRVFHGSARHRTRFDQRQGTAGIHQISSILRRRSSHVRVRDVGPDNRPGGGTGNRDIVLTRIGAANGHLRNVYPLVRTNVGVLEAAFHSNRNRIAGNQTVDCGGQFASLNDRCTIVRFRFHRHNRRDLLFLGVEGPGCRQVIIAGSRTGRSDREGTHIFYGEQSGAADSVCDFGTIRSLEGPGYGPVTARGTQLNGVAVADFLPCAGDGHRGLARREDFEHGIGRRKDIISFGVRNGQAVFVHVSQVGLSGSLACIRYRIFAAVNYKAVIIFDRNHRLLLFAVVRHLRGGHQNGGFGHSVDGNGRIHRDGGTVIVVFIALDSVPDRISVHSRPNGNGGGILSGLAQGIYHRAAFGGAGLHQFLRGAVVGQAETNRRSYLRVVNSRFVDGKGARTVDNVVSAVGVDDGNRSRTGVDVVAVLDGIFRLRGARTVNHRTAVLDRDGGFFCCAVKGVVICVGNRNHRADDLLRPDGDRNRTDGIIAFVVAVALHLIIYRVGPGVGFGGNVRRVGPIRIIQRIHHRAAGCDAARHQFLSRSIVGRIFGFRLSGQLCAAGRDGKVYRLRGKGVVSALVVRDGHHRRIAGSRHILVIEVADRILTGGNRLASAVIVHNDNSGAFLGAVILVGVGRCGGGILQQVISGKGNVRIVQQFRGDGHRNPLRLRIAVVVISLLHVPDRVCSGVGFLGDIRGINAVPGVGVAGIVIAAGHKFLCCACIRQRVFVHSRQVRGRLENGGRGGIGNRDIVLARIGAGNDLLRNLYRYVRTNISGIKAAFQINRDIIAGNQTVDYGGHFGIRFVVKRFVLRRHNRCDRLFQGVKRIGRLCVIIISAARFCRGDYRLSGAGNAHKTIGVNHCNARTRRDAPSYRSADGTACCAQGKGVAVVDQTGLVDDLQRKLTGLCDFKIGSRGHNLVVSAGNILNFDLVRALVFPVFPVVIDIGNTVLAVRNHVARFVFDCNRRLMHLAVIRRTGGRQFNLEVGIFHTLPGDGHINRSNRAVRVVPVAQDLVVDLVRPGVLGSGEVHRIVDAVQRVDHGSADSHPRRNQFLLLRCVIGQGVDSLLRGRRYLCRLRQNGRGDIGPGNFVLIRIVAGDSYVVFIQRHLLVCSHIVIGKRAGQAADRYGIACNQCAGRYICVDCDRPVIFGIGPVLRRHNRRDRFFTCAELPAGGHIPIIGLGAGRGNGKRSAHVFYGELSGLRDGIAACDLPLHGPEPGAARDIQIKHVAVVIRALGTDDGNRILLRLNDFVGPGVVDCTIACNHVVGRSRCSRCCDRNGVGVLIHHVVALAAGNRHRVLMCRNQTALVIVDRNHRSLRLAVVLEGILRQFDGGIRYRVFDNFDFQRSSGSYIAVVGIALNSVVNCVRSNRIRRGNCGSITPAVQGVEHRAVAGDAFRNQLLPFPGVIQVLDSLRLLICIKLCRCLFNFKVSQTAHNVVAAAGIADPDRSRTGVDVVEVRYGIFRLRGAGTVDLHSAVIDRDAGRFCCAVIGIGVLGQRNRRCKGSPPDRHRDPAARCVGMVGVALHLIIYNVLSGVGSGGNGL